MRDRPLIGLTMYGRNAAGRFDLPADYVDSVRRAGGIPLLLPPGENHWSEWLAAIDALILTGGGDVDPSLYQGNSHPCIERVDPERDQSELALARTVAKGPLPCLAICRGLQILNVALGGSLVEHIEERDPPYHRAADGTALCHPVPVDPGSRLAAALDRTAVTAVSMHHQALARVADGLKVVARTPDGVVEGAEFPAHPFLLGVQWHPEMNAREEPAQQRLFDALVQQARKQERTT